MKATDLMLGDWALCDGKPYQVAEISAGLLCIDAERELFAGPEDLQPIPLTPEILEKNGFIKRYNYQWKYRDNSCTIVISIAPQIEIEGEMLGTPPINVILEGALFNINMTSDVCVHQLQHALRLCGIEKEIVL